ncbi:MAG: hypothetical protein ACOX4I_09430 [Anaerovoracaceae bacterium]
MHADSGLLVDEHDVIVFEEHIYGDVLRFKVTALLRQTHSDHITRLRLFPYLGLCAVDEH